MVLAQQGGIELKPTLSEGNEQCGGMKLKHFGVKNTKAYTPFSIKPGYFLLTENNQIYFCA